MRHDQCERKRGGADCRTKKTAIEGWRIRMRPAAQGRLQNCRAGFLVRSWRPGVRVRIVHCSAVISSAVSDIDQHPIRLSFLSNNGADTCMMRVPLRQAANRFRRPLSVTGLGPTLLLGLAFTSPQRTTTAFSASATASATATTSSPTPTIPSETTEAIQGLQPSNLWQHFATLSSIPRPSGKESAVLSYIQQFATSNRLEWKQDAAGNLCVFRPGSGGGEDAPPVILQGHVDMVTEKNADTEHNFDTDPIVLERLDESSWLGAKGTTLGADNGIGCAAALTILGADATQPLPPIEALFTVEEETGLIGAAALGADALGLTGKTMLNLDMESHGELFVGCAGGGDATITLPLRTQGRAAFLDQWVEIRVEGLMGGHSGLNIGEGRANAVVLLAGAVKKVLDDVEPGKYAALVSLDGGDKHNAIPREARAVLSISSKVREVVEASVRESAEGALAEFGLLEKNLNMECKPISGGMDCHPTREALHPKSAQTLLSTLLALPHGPIKYSHALDDLVETSSNLASVHTDTDSHKPSATILCSSRSSIGSALENTRNVIKSVASLAGGDVELSEAYPGWNPNSSSEVLQVSQRLLQKITGGGEPAKVKAVHAGLECGLLMEKLGGDVDVISFGPTILGAHSPDERIDTETVPPFFRLVEDILAEYAKK